MTVVVDASVVVSALTTNGVHGRWAEGILRSDSIAGPHLLYVEVMQIVRRRNLAGVIDNSFAQVVLADLMKLSIDLSPFAPYAARVWELRFNLSGYDAWYVALAETLGAPLATLDRRIATAPLTRCEFLTPNS